MCSHYLYYLLHDGYLYYGYDFLKEDTIDEDEEYYRNDIQHRDDDVGFMRCRTSAQITKKEVYYECGVSHQDTNLTSYSYSIDEGDRRITRRLLFLPNW